MVILSVLDHQFGRFWAAEFLYYARGSYADGINVASFNETYQYRFLLVNREFPSADIFSVAYTSIVA